MLENKKKIYIIGTVGVPACYGGFESLVDNLLDYTPDDVEYTVFCTAKKYEKKLESYKGAHLIYLDRDANGKDSILYDYESSAERSKAKSSRTSTVLNGRGINGTALQNGF